MGADSHTTEFISSSEHESKGDKSAVISTHLVAFPCKRKFFFPRLQHNRTYNVTLSSNCSVKRVMR